MPPNDDQGELRKWDEESMRSLFASSDEVTRSLLSHLSRPENAEGVRQQRVAHDLELQRYIRKVVKNLRRRARGEYGRVPPVKMRTKAGRDRRDPLLVMLEDVAALVRVAERDVGSRPSPTRTEPDVSEPDEIEPEAEGRGEIRTVTTDTLEVGNGSRTGAIHVYEAGTRAGLHPLRTIGSLWRRRKLMFALARSQITARSNHTVLGRVWIFLEPLMFAAMYVLLVGILRGGDVSGGRLQRLVGSLFLFAFTRSSMQQGAVSVRGNQALLMNSSVPRALLPTSAVVQAFLELVPSLVLYAVIHVSTGLPVTVTLLAFPGLVAVQALFSLGLAMFVATLTVYVPDVQLTLRYLVRIWMYSTPVLWTVNDLRGNLDAVLDVVKWNPLFHLFAAYHRVWEGQWPTAWQWTAASAWAIGLLVLGFVSFASKERELAIRV